MDARSRRCAARSRTCSASRSPHPVPPTAAAGRQAGQWTRPAPGREAGASSKRSTPPGRRGSSNVMMGATTSPSRKGWTIPMAITLHPRDLGVRCSASLENLVFGQAVVVNRDYEGEIRAGATPCASVASRIRPRVVVHQELDRHPRRSPTPTVSCKIDQAEDLLLLGRRHRRGAGDRRRDREQALTQAVYGFVTTPPTSSSPASTPAPRRPTRSAPCRSRPPRSPTPSSASCR